MKKTILLLLITLLIIPSVLSLNLEVEKQSSDEVMIFGLNEPATFNLNITNKGSSEYVAFYSFFSPAVYPKGTIYLPGKQSQSVSLKIYPPEKIRTGHYIFDYYIRGENGDEMVQNLMVNVIELDDIFEIGSQEFDPQSSTIQIYLRNKINFDFEKINIKLSSAFFNIEKELSMEPNSKQNFTVSINKGDYKKLMAGYYTMDAEIGVGEKKTNIEGILKFVEKNIVTTNKKVYGFIINTNTIEKTNEGNVVATSETIIKKNIISRLFTTFSPEPNIIEREGFLMYYTWTNEINPGEILKINVRTNWLLPFVLLILIVLVVIIVKKSSRKALVLDKKVSFVNAKGCEFALKVSILVEAKSFVERMSVIDRLPFLTKIYEKFQGEKPSRVDEKGRKIEWNFERLQAGEKRVISYIIYSKIGVLGKFALPTATAIYEKDGIVKETHSNRAFFMIEPRARKDFED
ncbi:MAG: hypothetical protein ABIE36_01420 [Candidatus Diapherotrites archaeon]